jgi:hypothetical protein
MFGDLNMDKFHSRALNNFLPLTQQEDDNSMGI